MQMALERSNITSQDIDYVNGHGTGTRANDSAETTALKNLFSNTDKNVPEHRHKLPSLRVPVFQ